MNLLKRVNDNVRTAADIGYSFYLPGQKTPYLQIDEDAEAVLETIRADYSGTLPFDDKADPEVIREAFGLSKAAFKRAVGHLYRAKRVELRKGSIVAKEEQV